MNKYLYGASIQGIQGFIFQTNKLRDIVGASLLVEEVCTTLFEKEFAKDDDSAHKIIGVAGNIKYIFDKEEDCRRAVLLFPKRVMEHAPGITISQVVVCFDADDKQAIGKALETLEKNLRAQRNKQCKSLLYGQMGMKRSGETGLPVVLPRKDVNKHVLLDEGCAAKDDAVDKKLSGQSDLYTKLYGGTVPYRRNLNVSNMTGDNDWLAIIHADGNGLGQVVAEIGESGKIGDKKMSLSEFSAKLDNATTEAARIACATAHGLDKDNLLIRPVVIGGDDLTVICRADIAVPFVREYLKAFEEEAKGIGHLSACAGIAFIKSSYPFYYGYELAEILCSEAKKDAKSDKMTKGKPGIPSCLMFHKVQSSFVEDYATIKKKELTPLDSHSFCFGPYYLNEQTGRWTIDDLETKAKELAKEENNPVKTAIREWITLLKEGEDKAKQKATRVESLYKGNKQALFKDATMDVARDGKCYPAYDLLALLTINTQTTNDANVMDIEYTIEFYSYWHCGSGTSAGADVDELVIKDKSGLPFIPGKTLKGLIREAVESYVHFKGGEGMDGLDEIFGRPGGFEGCAHFSNACLDESERNSIVKDGLQDFLYEKLTTTSIDEQTGIAKEHSLRSMEVVVPCTLHARITGVPEDKREIIEKSLGLIKRLGLKRNRGLGRCDFKVKKEGGQ